MTTLNPNIILGVQRPKSINPMEMYQAKASIDQNELANRMGQMKIQEYEQGRADNALLRDAYKKFGADTTANVNSLYQAGLGKEAQGYAKSQADIAKERATGDKAKIETVQKVVGLMGSTAYALSQSPTLNIQEVAGAVEQLKAQLPQEYHAALDVSKLPQDPQGLRAALQSIYTKSIETDKILAAKTSRDNNTQTTNASIENNKRTVGASYANAAATRAVAASNVEAAKIKGDRDTEMKIADDYRAQSKTFKEVSDAYKTINATLDKATTSAAATLAGATKFMKLLDPGSVVRESELGMALAATGAFDRATNYFNDLKFGKVLTKAQAADFKNITAQIYNAAQTQQKAIDANYTQQAKTYGLRPEMIVQDLGQNTPAGGAKSSARAEADKILGLN